MKKTLEFLREQHRKAVVNGNHETAARIRKDIRDTARKAFNKGYTLEDII